MRSRRTAASFGESIAVITVTNDGITAVGLADRLFGLALFMRVTLPSP